MRPLYGLSRQDLEETLKSAGLDPLRIKQTIHGLYKSRAENFRTISTLPKDAKRILESEFRMFVLDPVRVLSSKDGCVKTLFRTDDGEYLESVVMPNTKEEGYTVCVSTQIGCPLACAFCASGRDGFIRNLAVHEIVEQAVRPSRKGTRITNIVFMGMGEPLLNTDAVLQAVRILNDPDLFGIGARQITISTAGLPDGIRRLAACDLQIRLAISLHFFRQEIREQWMPVAGTHPLPELVSALRDYQEKSGRQFTVEYALFKGINDHLQAADDMRKLLKGLNYRVNLIPWNRVEGLPLPFRSADSETAVRILKHLRKKGVPVSIRRELGSDIAAACGQLRASSKT